MKTIKNILTAITYLTIIWAGLSMTVQSIECPKMTQTEVLLNLPNSFACNFKCVK